MERPGIDVQEFAILDAVVEHAQRAQRRQQIGGEIEAGREIVVVIVWDRQKRDAGRARRLDGGENIVASRARSAG